MRRTLVALATATAVALTPVSALADASSTAQSELSSQFKGKNSDQLAHAASSNYNLNGSSYVQWLDKNVATSDNESTNTFLKVLVDFLIGAGIMFVVSTIYGEIAKVLP